MKKPLAVLLLLCNAALLFGQALVIAVNDFTVESDNAAYTYLGKGISRMVASELRKSGRVRLVEREQMNRLLAEQNFSVSDLADASRNIRIGKLLSAEYLVLGEIIDMGPAGMLISVRLVDTTTGEIPSRAEKQGTLAAYDYLSAYLATTLLASLNVAADRTTVAKVEEKREKQVEAIIKTSQGIDAYDKHDTATAKRALDEARQLDPTNDVAAEYLAKLPGNTSRFKLTLEPFYMDENPASLGLLKEDRLYLAGNSAIDALGDLFAFITRTSYPGFVLPNGDRIKESDWKCKLGYAVPLTDGLGFQVEAFYFGLYSQADVPPVPDPNAEYYRSLQSGLGGMVDGGVKIADWLSIGAGFSIYIETNYVAALFPGWQTGAHPAFSVQAGAVLQNPNATIVYDVQMGYCSGRLETTHNYFGGPTIFENAAPLFIEQTIFWALNGKRTFLICKQHNDIGLDRVYYYGSLIPAVEHHFSESFSARVGVELIYSRLDTADNVGYGATGGVTLTLGRVDLDVNLSFRSRPSRVVPGYAFPEGIITFGVNCNGLFVSSSGGKD
jgi:curli biogenesis system outer membrane secretion channel CsgG